MDLEARSLQPSVKGMLLAKLREYKSDLNNLKAEVKRITSAGSNQAARDELLEAGMADTSMVCQESTLVLWFLWNPKTQSLIISLMEHVVVITLITSDWKCFGCEDIVSFH